MADIRLILILATVLGVPLLVMPGILDSPVELPKKLLVETMAIAVWLTILAQLASGASLLPGAGRPLMPFLGIAAWSLICTAAAANPGFALEHSGLQLAITSLAAAVYLGTDRAGLERILGVALAIGAIEALYGILQYAGVEFLPWASNWGSRCFGTMGNPIFFAELLAPLFVLAAACWLGEEDEERRDLMALLIVVLFLALLFAQTRSAWLGAVIGLSVLGWCVFRLVPGGRARIGQSRLWLLAFLGFFVAVSATASSAAIFGKGALPLGERLADAVNRRGWSVSHRLVLWRAAAEMVREEPLLGVGPEHFRTAFPFMQARFREGYIGKGFFFAPKERSAHNDYVQLASEQGIVGLGLFIWLILSAARLGCAGMRKPGREGVLAAGLLGSLACLATDALFNFPFRVIPVATVFWISLGLLARTGIGEATPLALTVRKEAARPGPWRLRWGTVAGLFILAALWKGADIRSEVMADRAFARGMYYRKANMWEMASDAFQRSVRYRPYDATAHYHLGYVLFQSSGYDWTGHLWDRAFRHFSRSRELGLNDEKLYSQLALLLEKKGNLDGSIEMGTLALAIQPDNMDYAANLSYWLSQREIDLGLADELSARAAEAVPQHALYLWTRGLVLEKRGRHAEAVAILRDALAHLDFIRDGPSYEEELRNDISRVARAAGKELKGN